MKTISFRPARSEDHVKGARLVMETLHQFGVYLFGFGNEELAYQALESFFELPRNRFSFQFAEFAIFDYEIAGILMTFNRRQMHKSASATAFQMLRVYRVKQIGQFLKRMLPYQDEENIPQDELYIAHLAVGELFRRQGIGLLMLERAEKKARDHGLPKLSLLTEIENSAARTLYEKFGFVVMEEILFPEQMPYTGSKGDVRMVKILA